MKSRNNKIPDCGKCEKKRVALLPENYTAFSIVEKYGTVFTDGMGGINITSIKEIIDMYSLDDDEKLITLKLVVLFLKTAKECTGDNTNAKK